MKKLKIDKRLKNPNLGFFHKEGPYTTVYVGNLRYTDNEKDIMRMFDKFGKVNYIRLVIDRKTRKSKGIAFVQMPNLEDAKAAIKQLDGEQVSGRTLKVSIAIESIKRPKLSTKTEVKEKIVKKSPINNPLNNKKKKKFKSLPNFKKAN